MSKLINFDFSRNRQDFLMISGGIEGNQFALLQPGIAFLYPLKTSENL